MRWNERRAAPRWSFTVDIMPTPGARYRDAHSGMKRPKRPCAVTGRRCT
ncbi:hypothetical protein KCP70_10500 [Salmonella enterica subsp. enterica]|nr:hypothetical protein KCP70_10500 [Salmonella enterica subsp. enterica]